MRRCVKATPYTHTHICTYNVYCIGFTQKNLLPQRNISITIIYIFFKHILSGFWLCTKIFSELYILFWNFYIIILRFVCISIPSSHQTVKKVIRNRICLYSLINQLCGYSVKTTYYGSFALEIFKYIDLRPRYKL